MFKYVLGLERLLLGMIFSNNLRDFRVEFVEVFYEDDGLALFYLFMVSDWRGKDQQNLKRVH